MTTLPGFRHCPWCSGRGCIACDAEERKWRERQAAVPHPTVLELLATVHGTTPAALTAWKRKEERGCSKNPRFIPDLPGWAADQFRYCLKCDGKGCPKCPLQRDNFIRRAINGSPEWRPADIRDVRDEAVRAEASRAERGLDALTEDEVEAAFMPAMDVEYKRQFPNGPQPIASFQRCETEITGFVR